MDIMFLITDGPSEKGEEITRRKYSLLKRIVYSKLPGLQCSYRFVCSIYVKSLTKTIIREHQQDLFDAIEKEHPKVIVAFGDKAFMALGLVDHKITSIANTPLKSPLFGGKIVDKRLKRDRGKRLPVTARGVLADRVGMLTLVSYNDIWIYPTYKHQSLLSYGCGYKGQSLFERQLKCVEIIIKDPNFSPYDYTHYKKYVTLYRCKEDVGKAKTVLKSLENKRVYAFDLETAGYDIPKEAQLNSAHPKAYITMVGIGDSSSVHVFNTYKLPELVKPINEVLEGKKTHLTWNGKFDIDFCTELWKTNFYGHTHIDGMACLYASDIELAHLGKGVSTLKFTSATFLEDGPYHAGYQKNEGIYAAIREGDGKFLAAHEAEFMYYCGIDVWLTYRVNVLMWNKLSKNSRKLVSQYYSELTVMLNEVHKNGIPVNVKLLNEHIESLQGFCSSLVYSIREYVSYEMWKATGSTYDMSTFNPKSTHEIAKLLYSIMRLPERRTEKGTLTTSNDVLKEFGQHKVCRAILDYRKFEKQLEIFKSVEQHVKDGRCRPRYLTFRTTSGRLSAVAPAIQIIPKNKTISTVRKGKDLTPIQIIDHRPIWPNYTLKKHEEDGTCELVEYSPYFKEIFKADAGATFLYADYKQLEIYILGNYIENLGPYADRTLQEALLKGRDIHSHTASLLYTAITGKEYTYEFIFSHQDEYPYKVWRQDAKSVIFKLIYGGTAMSMAREKGITNEEAQHIWDSFLKVVLGIKQNMDMEERRSRLMLSTSTIGGHKRNLGILRYEPRNSKAKSILYNHPVQGSACYIVNLGMMEYHKRLKQADPKLGKILLTVHDSIASQITSDLVKLGVLLKVWCMEDYPLSVCDFLKIPIKIDLEIGTDWHNLKKIDIEPFRKYISDNNYKGETGVDISKLPEIKMLKK